MTRSELIACLEKAEGPSRELDYDIWALADPAGIKEVSRSDNLRMPWHQWREYHVNDKPDQVYGKPTNHQAYTASLDAAVALVERVLPGWRVMISMSKDGCYAQLHTGSDIETGKSAHPALALCIAALKALERKDGE